MNHEVKDFEAEVLRKSNEVPVLVDFWAPWCGPCRVLGPIIERLADEAAGRWSLAKVNTDEHPDLAAQYGIRSIPSVKLFDRGRVVDEFIGALPESEIRRWLEQALPSPHADTLVRAQELLSRGSREEAAKLVEPIVQAEPGNDQARLLLAEGLLLAEPGRIEDLLRPISVVSDVAEKAEGLRTLAKLAILADHPETLPTGDARERYLQGIRSIKAGDYGRALDAFIEVIRKDRNYDHEGAKTACKAIFQVLGIHHPIAEQYYNAFSSALYS